MRGCDLPVMYFGPEFLSDLNRAIQQEWIVANGLGGYASSTILNIDTRKYHGLLVAALNPPVDRHVLLSKVDEEVRISRVSYHLGSNEFRDVIHPDGYKRLRSFELNPLPVFQYEVSRFSLRKEVFMPHIRNMTIIRYSASNSNDEVASINLYPLVSMRHFHETTNRHACQPEFTQELLPSGVAIEKPPFGSRLALSCTDGCYSPSDDLWIEKIHFRVDESRGEDFTDDNYQPGFLTVEVPPKETKEFYLAAALAEGKEEKVISHRLASLNNDYMKKLYAEEIARGEKLLQRFYENKAGIKPEDWLNWLVLSVDSFVVRRRSTGKRSVIAGYHWFEDWGRDTLISLPGLTLVTRRFRDAEEVLLTFRQYCRDGLVPNRFPDRSGEEPVYDSADATLWFFNAVLQYLKYTSRLEFVRKKLWDALQDVVEQHIHGTAFGIRVDDDGLLLHGPRLTWMDVSINGKPVTPRAGKAVEIQALWYNALRTMEMLASRFGEGGDAERYGIIAERTRRSFNEKFWWSEGEYLFDTVVEDRRDPSLRPNQIIAAYLDFCMLDDRKMEKVVEAVWRGLWGTYGLKTLPSDDARYIGRCAGGFAQREMAYHNGTVWAWLLGPFVTAFLKTKSHREDWRMFAFEKFLQPLFLEETYRCGLGTLSEIFDGDPPHTPRGCVSQAWSVAEPLRAFVEDALLNRPPYEAEIWRH